MSRLIVVPKMWGETRFAVLQECTGYSQRMAIGTLVMFWLATRERKGATMTYDDIARCLPCPLAERGKLIDSLVDASYLRTNGQALYEVVDNEAYFETMAKFVEAGRRGGNVRHKPITNTRKSVGRRQTDLVVHGVAPPPQPVATKADPNNLVAWASYERAYRDRWKVEPVRNAKVNSQVAAIVKAVGADTAPNVLAFYVRHNDPLYVQRQHDMSLALRDISGLTTQYRRGAAITRNDVREHEGQDRFRSQVERLRGV